MIREYVLFPILIYVAVFPLRCAILSALERRYVAHPFHFRSVIGIDLATMGLGLCLIGPAAYYVSNRIGVRAPIPHAIDVLPLVVRIGLYLVVADLGHYWLHRLMHTRWLWRVHQWHHAPTHMSWSAGLRETFFDATIVNLAYVFAWPLLGSAGYRTQILLMALVVVKNDWMHLNVRWHLPRLEAIFVTPRYHHIHHSADPAHHQKNLGVLFSPWDRLFGTHFKPDEASRNLRFGISEKVPALRLVLGL